MSKIVYIYDEVTKEYLYSMECQYDPNDEDILLTPPNSVDIKPIKVGVNQVAVLADDLSCWDIQSDYRNQDIYKTDTKEKSQVDYIGEIKNGWTLLEPSEYSVWDGTQWQTDISLYKEDKLEQAKTQRELYLAKGVKYKDITFYSTKDDTKDLVSLGILTMQQGQVVKLWKGIDGYLENPSIEELTELTQICSENLQKAYIAEATLIEEINQLNEKSIQSYNVESRFDEVI